MKKLFCKTIDILTWNPTNSLVYLLFKKLASKITGDNNYKSNKNEFLAIFFIFLSVLMIILCMLLYSYYSLPWSSLQRHYAFYAPVEYQNNDYEIIMKTPEKLDQKTIYYVKLMLDNKGFYFSQPIEYFGPISRGNIMIFEHPLFIPWTEIKECKKIQYRNYNKMQLHVDKANVLLEIALWDFLKPLCIKNRILIREN